MRVEGKEKEIGLEVSADKTKYMVMSGDQNAGWSHNIKTDSSSFERVEEFKYLGITFKTKLRGLSPHANYTDRAAAAGRRS